MIDAIPHSLAEADHLLQLYIERTADRTKKGRCGSAEWRNTPDEDDGAAAPASVYVAGDLDIPRAMRAIEGVPCDQRQAVLVWYEGGAEMFFDAANESGVSLMTAIRLRNDGLAMFLNRYKSKVKLMPASRLVQAVEGLEQWERPVGPSPLWQAYLITRNKARSRARKQHNHKEM